VNGRRNLKDIPMKSLPAVFGLMLLASPLHADNQAATAKVVVKPVLSATMTSSGQPIVLPQKNAQVLVSTYEIPPGAVLPKHKHPFPRYAYVQAGTIAVTNTDTGKTETFKTGDFILEAVDQWHYGANTGTDPVKLLVIDMVEKGQANVVLQK
jgi:quercetin dioxygenase-like cupin family protein